MSGGAGFIGSNVVRYLLSKGWDVRVLDDLSTGHMANISGLNIDFVQGDICCLDTCMRACRDREVVFHLAACVGRQKSLDDPQHDAKVNLIGTINLLEAMRHNHVKRIVYSSSAAIFGEVLTQTISENHPQNADSPYGVSKLAAEKAVLAYSGIYNIESVCLRYFNIYGLNQRFDLYGNVVPIFVKRIFSGEEILIYGDGEQTRDFLNVYDVANANFLAATIKINSGVFNLGSGTSITINRLAELLLKIAGAGVPIKYLPERLADVKHCKADISNAESILGFSPSVSLEKGLSDYINWYRLNS